MPDDESIATQAVRHAMDIMEQVKDRLRLELAAGIGQETVTVRKARGLARKALDGDDDAWVELNYLAQTNGCTLDMGCDCPVCRQVGHVLKEKADASS